MRNTIDLQSLLTTLARPRWVFVIILALCLLTLARKGQYYGRIYHGWDAQFYYSLAHSIVFDGDVDITNNIQATPAPDAFDPDRDGNWSPIAGRTEHRIPDKYPIGMSLIEAPFLMIGRALRAIGIPASGKPGYSALELWTVAVGLLIVFAAGLTLLYRMLAEEFGPAAAIGIAGCWMGTSLLYYSAAFPFMSHAMSFVMLVCVLATSRAISRATDESLNRSLALLGLSFAGVFLVRPQQVIVAAFLVPLIWRAIRHRPARHWLIGLTIAAACGFAGLAAQLLSNYAQFHILSLSGYAISGERFDWLHPRLGYVLFDSKRGLIAFSPIVLLAALGYARHWRSIPTYAWPALANALAQIYLIAAWWAPDGGDSFGCRMWADNSAAAAFGLAVLFHRQRAGGRWVLLILMGTSIAWTTLQLARYIGLVRW